MNSDTQRHFRPAAERGAAMVELAVLMLALLPMILLPLYFQDTMFYKLNLQERVFSSAWTTEN